MSRFNTIVYPSSASRNCARGATPAAFRQPVAASHSACAIERLEGRVVPSTILVTSLADSGHGTLRAAILKANNDMHDWGGRTHTDTIKFAHAVKGTISLQSALPVLSGHFAINGPGASVLTVDGSGSTGISGFRIFTVATGAVISISGLGITGGSSTQGGGGIDNAGTLSLADVAIHGNSVVGIGSGPVAANSGGGIENTGTLSITNSSVYNNSATGSTSGTGNAGYGGGIANTGSTLGCELDDQC